MDNAELNPDKVFLIGLHDMIGKYEAFVLAGGHDPRHEGEPEIITALLEHVEKRTTRTPGLSPMVKVLVVGVDNMPLPIAHVPGGFDITPETL